MYNREKCNVTFLHLYTSGRFNSRMSIQACRKRRAYVYQRKSSEVVCPWAKTDGCSSGRAFFHHDPIENVIPGEGGIRVYVFAIETNEPK